LLTCAIRAVLDTVQDVLSIKRC